MEVCSICQKPAPCGDPECSFDLIVIPPCVYCGHGREKHCACGVRCFDAECPCQGFDHEGAHENDELVFRYCDGNDRHIAWSVPTGEGS